MGIKFLRNVHIDDPYIFCFKCFGGLYDLCSSLKFYSYVIDALLVTLNVGLMFLSPSIMILVGEGLVQIVNSVGFFHHKLLKRSSIHS